MSKYSIDQHYQMQKSSITAPKHLDEAIINHAHSAVEKSNHSKPVKPSWLMPLSTAATIIVCGLTFLFISHHTQAPSYSAVAINVAEKDSTPLFADDTLYADAVEATPETPSKQETTNAEEVGSVAWAHSEDASPVEVVAEFTHTDTPPPQTNHHDEIPSGDIAKYTPKPTAPSPMAKEMVIAEADTLGYQGGDKAMLIAKTNTLDYQDGDIANKRIQEKTNTRADTLNKANKASQVNLPPLQKPVVKPLKQWANRVIMLINGNQITLAKREYKALKKAYPNADSYKALIPYIEQLNAVDE